MDWKVRGLNPRAGSFEIVFQSIVVTPSQCIRWSNLDTATYQCPPKSYTAGLHQVSEAPSLLSRSNHREKSRRKAEEKKNKHIQKTINSSRIRFKTVVRRKAEKSFYSFGAAACKYSKSKFQCHKVLQLASGVKAAKVL